MYTEFFKLSQLPFRLSADPRFYFLGSGHEAAKHHLRVALADSDGCLFLTGDAGTGKSTLLQDLVDEIPPEYAVVHLRNPEFSIDEFYQAVLAQLDDRAPAGVGNALRASFDTCLAGLAALRCTMALMIDDGESMSGELLEEVMRLPRRKGNGTRNLRILVASRPSIEKSLSSVAGGGRQNRPALHVRLSPLSSQESRLYIRHRLSIASGGTAEGTFLEDAFPHIHRYTGGVPRLINTLADASMIVCFNRNRERVSATDVRTAVDQLKWVEFASRPDAPFSPAFRPRDEFAAEVVDAAPAITGHARIEKGGSVLAEFDLPVGKISIGRAVANDVRIDSQYISRHHCQIMTTANYSVIEDMQSQNGLMVGNRRVSVHRLHDGETVQLGDLALTYSILRRPPTAHQAPLRMVVRQHKVMAFGATHVLAPAGNRRADAGAAAD